MIKNSLYTIIVVRYFASVKIISNLVHITYTKKSNLYAVMLAVNAGGLAASDLERS